MTAELATLAAAPSRVADVAPEALPALLGELEALRAVMWARLQAPTAAPRTTSARREGNGEDQLLTADQVAVRLGVDRRWVYRRADALPFTRRLSRGTLRFSARGLERWKESRRAGGA
jgi:predicted DNA-binding transcriptional regulator AlpA